MAQFRNRLVEYLTDHAPLRESQRLESERRARAEIGSLIIGQSTSAAVPDDCGDELFQRGTLITEELFQSLPLHVLGLIPLTPRIEGEVSMILRRMFREQGLL